MELIIFFVLFGALFSVGGFLFYYQINKKLKELPNLNPHADSFQLLNQNIQGMHERLDKTQTTISERLDNAARVMTTVGQELGQMQEIGRHMRSLQDFLKSPKLRGNIGEQVLKDLLEQYFSRRHFDLQYRFKDGQMVDAIIKTSNGLIPIDAKFPLENFQKLHQTANTDEQERYLREFMMGVKKHIQDIAKKYILPSENTVDFAIMYIPSEAVYYEIVRHDLDLNTFAYSKRVFPVSPNSFYYFLRVLMLGMEGQRVQESAKKILSTLQGMKKESERFGEEIVVMNTHLTHASGSLNRLSQRHAKLSAKLENTTLLEGE